MLRESTLLLYRDSASPAERVAVLRGLAYLGTECLSVSGADYGQDLLGGSGRLLEVPPWKRTPRFHARAEGPPSNYDVALHLDLADEAAVAACSGDPARAEVESVTGRHTVGELGARVLWRPEGAPHHRGRVRHVAMHVWREEADAATRATALDAVAALAGRDGVESVATGENLGGRVTDFDWILELQVADEQAARALLAGGAYLEASAVVAAATKHEWTARVTHLMRGR
jgi:hypothetical protein